MRKHDFKVGDLVLPTTNFNLFSTIWHRTADGSTFKPVPGPHEWFPGELAVIVESFTTPFQEQTIYRVLLSAGGTGWAWSVNIKPASV